MNAAVSSKERPDLRFYRELSGSSGNLVRHDEVMGSKYMTTSRPGGTVTVVASPRTGVLLCSSRVGRGKALRELHPNPCSA
jgi:hypothetical protein